MMSATEAARWTLPRRRTRPAPCRQLDAALQAEGITGLTEDIQLAVVSPEASLRMLPAPARLHVLRDADPLTAATYEEDGGRAG
jgi:hypothetical protein